MKLEKKRYDDIVILKFTGEFDTFNLPAFSERIEKMIEGGDVLFILDVHLLTFINSSAFGYLLRLRKLLKEKGGAVVLARPSKFMRKTLVTFGVEDVFPVYEGVEDAIMHYKKGADVGQLDLEGTESDEALHGEVPVLFRQLDAGGGETPNQVGRIVSLYPSGLLFRYEAASDLDSVALSLEPGTKLKLKFRQPFVVKDRYFEMDGDVREIQVVEPTEGEEKERVLSILVDYDKIKDEDRKFLDQFIRDQAEWRGELNA